MTETIHIEDIEKKLVQRIQQGDQDAWGTFLERYTHLIYAKACEYGRSAQDWGQSEDWEDELGDLYLFMAQLVQKSLKSYKGECKPGTWVISVIKNRGHVIKAYLMAKDPARADVRLPKILEKCSGTDADIFKRLVWGLAPVHIAQELTTTEAHVDEIENLLRAHSPRVYARIQANRQARIPTLSLDFDDEEGESPPLQIVAPNAQTADEVATAALLDVLTQSLEAAFKELATAERRLLILLYQQQMSIAEIVELATSDPHYGLTEITDINRAYYLRNASLRKILDRIVADLEAIDRSLLGTLDEKELRKRLEELLQEQGVPLQRV